jgi:hypothetical protein
MGTQPHLVISRSVLYWHSCPPPGAGERITRLAAGGATISLKRSHQLCFAQLLAALQSLLRVFVGGWFYLFVFCHFIILLLRVFNDFSVLQRAMKKENSCAAGIAEALVHKRH